MTVTVYLGSVCTSLSFHPFTQPETPFNRALSDQYYGTDTHHKAIRQEVCDYLKRYEENYKFFVEDDQSFEHHVECMEQDATFGGNMELAAFAKMRAVDIKVYQPGMM